MKMLTKKEIMEIDKKIKREAVRKIAREFTYNNGKCMFWKDGKCNSMYAKGLKCDGIHPPEKCPWDLRKLEVVKCPKEPQYL
jgi:hypothetical protein